MLNAAKSTGEDREELATWRDIVASSAANDVRIHRDALSQAARLAENALIRAGFQDDPKDPLMAMARKACEGFGHPSVEDVERAIRLRNDQQHAEILRPLSRDDCVRAVDTLRHLAAAAGDVEALAAAASARTVKKAPSLSTLLFGRAPGGAPGDPGDASGPAPGPPFAELSQMLTPEERDALLTWTIALSPGESSRWTTFKSRIASIEELREIVRQPADKRFAILDALYARSQTPGETLAAALRGEDTPEIRALQARIDETRARWRQATAESRARAAEIRARNASDHRESSFWHEPSFLFLALMGLLLLAVLVWGVLK